MAIKRCEKCNEWIFDYTTRWASRPHKCLPLWLVQCPEYDDESWDRIYAVDAEEAATKLAEKYDSDNHDMMDGDTIVVRVRREINDYLNLLQDNQGDTAIIQGEIKVEKFRCSGEAIPTYYATEIKEDADD